MGYLNIIDVDPVAGDIVRRLIEAVDVTPYTLAKLGLNHTSMEPLLGDVLQRLRAS